MTNKQMTKTTDTQMEEIIIQIKAKAVGISGTLNGSAVHDTGQAVVAEQKLGDILDLVEKLETHLTQVDREARRELVKEIRAWFSDRN